MATESNVYRFLLKILVLLKITLLSCCQNLSVDLPDFLREGRGPMITNKYSTVFLSNFCLPNIGAKGAKITAKIVLKMVLCSLL